MAELWGLYQGLCMAWQQGCRWISVEVDSLCVTQLVSNPVAYTYEYAPPSSHKGSHQARLAHHRSTYLS